MTIYIYITLRVCRERQVRSEDSKKQNPFPHILHDQAAFRFLEPASDLVGTNRTTTGLPAAKLYDQHPGVIWVQLCNQIMPVG